MKVVHLGFSLDGACRAMSTQNRQQSSCVVHLGHTRHTGPMSLPMSLMDADFVVLENHDNTTQGPDHLDVPKPPPAVTDSPAVSVDVSQNTTIRGFLPAPIIAVVAQL